MLRNIRYNCYDVEGLRLAFKKHRDWIEIVQSFGCNIETAEDLVSEMYIKLDKAIKDGRDISYNNDINHLYIFKILTTLFLDLKRKEAKMILVEYNKAIDNRPNEYVDYEKNYEKILDTLEGLYWYDQKVYEIIESGESIAELSKKTKISYYSLYRTYNRVKQILKDTL